MIAVPGVGQRGPALAASDVAAIFVTYGARTALVDQAVRAVGLQGVRRVIIVDNGSVGRLAETITAIQSEQPKLSIQLVRLGTNGGSAIGFARGLEEFLGSGHELAALLLDDDNVVQPGCVEELLNYMNETPEAVAAVAYRPSRPRQAAIAAGRDPAAVYPPANAFVYFDVFRRARVALSGLLPSSTRSPRVNEKLLPYAPYGGLLIRRAVAESGLPDANLVLYEDDAEFSLRVIGQAVPLVPSARIADIDENYLVASSREIGPWRFIRADNLAASFYAIRNRVYVERRYLVTNRLAFLANGLVFGLVLALGVRCFGDIARTRLLLRAAYEGAFRDPSDFSHRVQLE